MRRRLIFWTVIIGFALLGAIGAALIAAQRSNSAAATRQFYLASMVNPPRTLESPRTYNQTLAESINLTTLASDLTDIGYPVTAVRLDILPDSYHIQATTSLGEELDDTTATRLGQALATQIGRQSAGLAAELLDSSPVPNARVVLTKTLPSASAVTQNPLVTGFFGALAGALVGLFVALSLPTANPAPKKAR
jgi:hypothetical protein